MSDDDRESNSEDDLNLKGDKSSVSLDQHSQSASFDKKADHEMSECLFLNNFKIILFYGWQILIILLKVWMVKFIKEIPLKTYQQNFLMTEEAKINTGLNLKEITQT